MEYSSDTTHAMDARREFEALFAFSRKLVAAAGVEQIASALVRTVDDLLDIDAAMVLLIEREPPRAYAVAALRSGVEHHPVVSIDLDADRSAVSQVVRSSSAHRVLDGERESLHNREIAAALDGLTSALYVPLSTRDGVVGVLVAGTDGELRAFRRDETEFVQKLADDAAVAIERARIAEELREEGGRGLALARAAQALTADLRFDRVLDRIVSEVVKVIPTASAAFYVYDRDEQKLTLSAAFGEAEQDAVGTISEPVGLAGRVVQTGVSQYTNSYEQDLGGSILPVFRGITRAVAVPVRWQGDLRGVISVAARDDGRQFGERDVSLLEAFADLASLALHNAEAYSANSRQARIQAGFYRIAQVFSSSLSRPETLEALAQAATDSLDGDFSIVVGGIEDASELHVEGNYAAPVALLDALDMPDVLHQGPAPFAVHHRRIVTARNVGTDTRFGVAWHEVCAAHGVISQLAVPIKADGERAAVVVVCFQRAVRFGDEELVVASNLASAASAALERAGLFENERRARRLAEVLADVSALIAETLKTQTVLERIVDQAAVLLGADACTLAVVDQADPQLMPLDVIERVELRVHAAAGHDAPLVGALTGAAVGGLVEDVARTKRPETVSELASETSAQALGAEHYDSYLGVPMLHPRGHLIGVLSVYSRAPRIWDTAEVGALESFASTAAIAIRNAELYADIKRQRDTIEKLLGSIAEGIVATDASGRVTLWNQAAEQIAGIARPQAVGRPWRDVFGLSSDADLATGTSVVEARPAGSPMWLSITASPLREEGGEHGFIYAFRDVSATWTLDRLKSDFVSTVSYVLRAPLTSIYGFAQTLLRDDIAFTDTDRAVFLEYIAAETEHLTGIVDDLLHASQIDAGSVSVHVEDCDVHEVLQQVVDDAREQAPGRRIELDVAPGRQLFARADADKLRRVLTNLIDNAVQFTTDDGRIDVRAERENGSVNIAVTDSGMGIPPSEQKHLFTKFYVSPQAGEIGGSGLGLYISKGLVTAMGGSIAVSSQVGEGSTFTVELPAARAASGTEADT